MSMALSSLPHLFALAHGADCVGPHRCAFCGAPASEPHELSSSFTTRDTLRAPGSGHICRGCLLCLEEVGEAAYHTGERGLPVHANYGMLGGGRWPREHLRTASIGGERGVERGRRDWEAEYYGDVLRRLEAGR